MEEYKLKKSFFCGNVFIRKLGGMPNVEKLILSLDSIFKFAKIVKNGLFVQAAIFRFEGDNFFIKKYLPRSFLYKIGYFFKQTRAEHAWNASIRLDEYFIPNPKVYLVVSKRFFRFIKTSYLITESVRDVFCLDYFKTIFSNGEKSNIFYAKIVKQLSMVHNAGIYHSDAKLWNFYAYKDLNGEEQIGILDLDGAIIYEEISMRKRALDLSRTIASIIELNNQTAFDVYNSEFIDKIILIYEKYSYTKINRKNIFRLVTKILTNKKIT